jgi:hypothetical protein
MSGSADTKSLPFVGCPGFDAPPRTREDKRLALSVMARIPADAQPPAPLPAAEVLIRGGIPGISCATGITTAAVMVVAELAPEHAWRQPILRLIDITVGAAAAWIGNQVIRAGGALEQQRGLVAGETE